LTSLTISNNIGLILTISWNRLLTPTLPGEDGHHHALTTGNQHWNHSYEEWDAFNSPKFNVPE
jgi:hypothetical protein